ncbi:hypothetical protein [Lentzea sp. CC55]|uniref:hypothetical protein n=1 Tax=Lentzea sp. CC55 TaxID=2884909 RepID=UPI001F2B0D2D|nr:hypothetical protein [Lentzea sp. CC55]MCG8927570.1 hypothetical protein [Lentzea sp. CC55]
MTPYLLPDRTVLDAGAGTGVVAVESGPVVDHLDLLVLMTAGAVRDVRHHARLGRIAAARGRALPG